MPDGPYNLLNYDGSVRKAGQVGVEQAYGIFAEASVYPNYLNLSMGTRFFGCLAYVLPSQKAAFTGAFFVTRVNNVQLYNCHASVQPGQIAFYLAGNDRERSRGTELKAWHLSHYGGSVKLQPEWEYRDVGARLPFPETFAKLPHQGDATGDGNVDVGDLGILSGHWGERPRWVGWWEVGDFNKDGWVNQLDKDIISANWPAAPLWPWPMDERIKQAMVLGGYPAISVTEQVQQAFGVQLVEEPTVSEITLYPVAGGMYRYLKNGDLALGETYSQNRSGLGNIQPTATDNFAGYVKSAYDSENEGCEIQRCGYRFSMDVPELAGKVIQSVSFRANLEVPGSIEGKVRLMQTSLLWPMSNTGNFVRCLTSGATSKGLLTLVSGTEYKVDLPAEYVETLDLAVVEDDHDYADNGNFEHDSPFIFISGGDNRPRLVVTYTDPAPEGPPVGTLGMLGVGR